MLIYWLANGSPHYSSMETGQSIAYISDVGATELKPLFIAGACVTTIFLDLAFVADRWLRHKGVLVHNTTLTEKVLSAFGILFAIVGTAGLILLSCFDTAHYPRLHDIFLALFIAGYVVSAIFVCAEYQRLGRKHRQHRVLRISFWIKLAFIIVEIALAIVFGVTQKAGNRNVSAIVEWVIALIFTFWVLSFLVDLIPAVRSTNDSKHGAGVEMGGPSGMSIVGDEEASGYRGTPQTNGSAYGLDGVDKHQRPLSAARNF